jgi:hypothetical protein
MNLICRISGHKWDTACVHGAGRLETGITIGTGVSVGSVINTGNESHDWNGCNAESVIKSAMKDIIGTDVNAGYVIPPVMKNISGQDVFVPGVIKKPIIRFIIGNTASTGRSILADVI